MNNRVTPSFISDLEENEIFVFGSNLEGIHGVELLKQLTRNLALYGDREPACRAAHTEFPLCMAELMK